MAGVSVSASSGDMSGSTSVARYPTESDGSESSDDSSSSDEEDTGAGARRRRIPDDYRARKVNFADRVQNEKFWDVNDEYTWLAPLSLYFLVKCARTSAIIGDVGDFILPPEVEEGTADVPTQKAATRARLLVKLNDKLFFLALQKLQKLLRKDFKVEWFTLPFSLKDPQKNEVSTEQIDLASATHEEAVALFANTVNKMHKVELLVDEADARGTEATRGFQRNERARACAETVRKNMWILNHQFKYDRNLGGFYRAGDLRKGAIALITSPAAAAKVKGGPETVRPPPKKRQRRQRNKRPENVDTQYQTPRETPGQPHGPQVLNHTENGAQTTISGRQKRVLVDYNPRGGFPRTDELPLRLFAHSLQYDENETPPQAPEASRPRNQEISREGKTRDETADREKLLSPTRARNRLRVQNGSKVPRRSPGRAAGGGRDANRQVAVKRQQSRRGRGSHDAAGKRLADRKIHHGRLGD